MHKLQTTISDTSRVVRQSPVPPAFISDFVVPLCVSGAMGTILVIPLIVAQYYVVAAIIGAIAWVGVFVWRLLVCDKRAWRIEQFTPPEPVPQVEPQPTRAQLPIIMDGGRIAEQVHQVRSQRDVQRLLDFIALAEQGITAELDMKPYGFDREDWTRYRGLLMGLKVADWKQGGRNQGWELLVSAEEAFEAYVEAQHPHYSNDPRD